MAQAKKISCYYYKQINYLYYPIIIHSDYGYQMMAIPPFVRKDLIEAWVKGRNRDAGVNPVDAFKIQATFLKAENGKEAHHV